MEGATFRKDTKEYLIFPCSKCGRYLYVKATQKTKKCFSCGRTNRVSSLKSYETVEGMTEAVQRVKERQNALAVGELGFSPTFQTKNEFKLAKIPVKKPIHSDTRDDYQESSTKFLKILEKIRDNYSRFPFQVLEMLAIEEKLPVSELRILVKEAEQKGTLTKEKDNYYSF